MLEMHTSNFFIFGFLAVAVLIGCGETSKQEVNQQSDANRTTSEQGQDEGHITADDVERPTNYADAVVRITSYRDSIRDEIAAGRPDMAHRPLDEMNFVVEWLPEIAQHSNVPKKNWEALNVAAQTIRMLLDKVHERIDKGEDPNFNSVADGIEESLSTLSSIRGDMPNGDDSAAANVSAEGRGQ